MAWGILDPSGMGDFAPEGRHWYVLVIGNSIAAFRRGKTDPSAAAIKGGGAVILIGALALRPRISHRCLAELSTRKGIG